MSADLSRRVERLELRAPSSGEYEAVLFTWQSPPPGVNPARILWIELVGVKPNHGGRFND